MVMAKKGEIQNYCFDKESNISLQCGCGCSFRVFLDFLGFSEFFEFVLIDFSAFLLFFSLDMSNNQAMCMF